MTQFTVIVDVTEGESAEDRAEREAERILTSVLENHYINSKEGIFPLHSDPGEEAVERAYEQTKDARIDYLTEIQDAIEERGVKTAAVNEDVHLAARRLSAPEAGRNRLIDGSEVRPGEPIISEKHLEQVRLDTEGKEQYVVVFEVERV